MPKSSCPSELLLGGDALSAFLHLFEMIETLIDDINFTFAQFLCEAHALSIVNSTYHDLFFEVVILITNLARSDESFGF